MILVVISIYIDNNKCGTGYCIPRTPTLGDALDEGRGVLLRLLLVLGLLGGCAAIALSASPRLGLDLRGGTQITLQTDHVACLQGCAQARPDAAGLFGAATEKIHRGDIQVLHL